MVGTRERLEDQAAAFLQKRDGGAWSEGDQAELTGWLAASVAHRVSEEKQPLDLPAVL